MNKKGFTLVELLASLIILTLLALLTSTAVTKFIKDSKTKLSNAQKELVKSAAETWAAENLSKIPNEGSCGYLTLQDLKEYGFIDSNILDPNTSKKLSNDLKIKITTTRSSGSLLTNYELTEDVLGCKKIYDFICTAVSTPTKGKVPTGNYLPGDEYTCEVKPGTSYTFFVLSTEENKVNLIMDSNICEDGTLATDTSECYIPWISEEDYKSANTDKTSCSVNNSSDVCNDEGPITAINKLNLATSGWSNIENLNEIYDAENGKYINFELNGKARMPKKLEVINAGCSTSCPSWIVPSVEYWLLDPYDNNSYYAYSLTTSGTIGSGLYLYSEWLGIRPVIAVSKYRIKN